MPAAGVDRRVLPPVLRLLRYLELLERLPHLDPCQSACRLPSAFGGPDPRVVRAGAPCPISTPQLSELWLTLRDERGHAFTASWTCAEFSNGAGFALKLILE